MTATRRERIHAFLDLVSPRISPNRYEDVARYLREDELQLALELLGDSLEELDLTLAANEWATFRELAECVDLDPADFRYLRAEST